ncbi:MAG: hypothetical protein IT367_18150 [Candidatus Hydrogenedentes bacterium]|nr:hypothetical protein [Candidatus Hydrogenedentota bacterium]
MAGDTPYAVCLGSTAGSAALAAQLLGWRVVACVEECDESAACVERRVADGCLPDACVFRGSVGEFVRGGFAGELRRLGGSIAVVACGLDDAWLAERGADLFACLRALEPGIVVLGGDEEGRWGRDCAGFLADLGFDAEWDCVPAAACGSPQTGLRSWLVAVRRADADSRPELAA